MSSLVVHEVAGGGPYGVAVTGDGAVWCTLVHGSALLRRDVSGTVSTLGLGDGSQPSQAAAAGDDSVWVTDTAGDRLVLLGPAGELRSVPTPTPAAQPFGVVSLDDGSAWFTELANDSLGRIGILGGVTEFAAGTDDGLVSMIAASGESLWFTANQANAIGYVRGGDSAPVLHPLPTADAGPVGIAVGDDGAAWFCEVLAGAIGRIDRAGRITEFPLPVEGSKPHAIVAAPYGAARPGCWFTLWGTNELGFVGLDGAFTFVDLASSGHAEPHGLAVAADGTVWVAMETGALLEVSP
jgi:virginiamycin B lyase